MDGSDQNSISPGRGILEVFATKPWLGLIASISSIISVPLAFYLYALASPVPRITYVVDTKRTVLVKQGTVSGLSVLHAGKPVTTDLTAAQVSLWNAGRGIARKHAVLQPLFLTTDPPASILEARIQRRSRDVTALALDSSEAEHGRVRIDFQILEGGDGAIVQVVYGGPPEIAIRLEGALEGQPSIEAYADRRTPSSRRLVIIGVIITLLGVLLVLLYASDVLRAWRIRQWPRKADAFFLLLGLYNIWRGLVDLHAAAVEVTPPF